MRILITAAPFHGHLNAVLPLARAAHRSGHDVVVATGADLGDEVVRRGLVTWPIGPTNLESGMPRSLAEFWMAADKRATDLMPRAMDWRPDLVVSEEMEAAGAIVAARLGSRFLLHGLGIAAAGDPAAYAGDLDELGREWAVPNLAERHVTAPYLSVCPPTLRVESGTRRRVLSLRPAVGEPAPGDRLPSALDALPYDDTVHLTLGTVFHQRRPEAMSTAIAGLRDLPFNLVVTVGPRVAPEQFGPQPANVFLTAYLPHSLLLPRCRLVVSQGGAGIVFGALAHGLPQLVLPQGADQFLNGAAVARAGVGLVLEGEEATAASIADAARRLAEDPAYTAAARVVRDEIAAMPTPGEVVAELAAMA